MTGLKIVFFGSGPFALPVLERLHAASSTYPLLRVVTRPDRPQARGRKVLPTPVRLRATELGIPCDAPETANAPSFLEALGAADPDLFLVADYGEMLRRGLREIPRLGIFNLHGSLLPRWRGAAPVAHAILAGDTESGVTLFRIERGLDSGPIVDTEKLALGEHETAGELEARLALCAADLIERNLPRFAAGPPRETAQDESRVTLAPKLDKASAQIDWEASAEAVSRQVRAYNPWPGAFSFLGGERTIFLRVRPIAVDPGPGSIPGSIAGLSKNSFSVRCGSGAVAVLELQREGKSPLDAAAYLRGKQFQNNDRFEGRAVRPQIPPHSGAGSQAP